MLKSSLRLLASPCLRERVYPVNFIGEVSRLTYNPFVNISRKINCTAICKKSEDKKMMLASLPAKDEGTLGEKSVQIDNLVGKADIFPDEATPFKMFDGTPFKDLPICNIRVSHNNTILTITDSKEEHAGISHMRDGSDTLYNFTYKYSLDLGEVKMGRSCGAEGFKNARKGTNIAAQATATTFSLQALQNGYKTIRVRVRGLGPGRMSAIKGLQIGGLDIVSITDSTRVSWKPPRARKARRL